MSARKLNKVEKPFFDMLPATLIQLNAKGCLQAKPLSYLLR